MVKDKEDLLKIDEFLLNESIYQFIEEKLKHISQSDFIYNKKLPDDLENLDKEKIINLVKQLYADHYRVCRDNEQYRTMNFKQYLQLKKLKVED